MSAEMDADEKQRLLERIRASREELLKLYKDLALLDEKCGAPVTATRKYVERAYSQMDNAIYQFSSDVVEGYGKQTKAQKERAEAYELS